MPFRSLHPAVLPLLLAAGLAVAGSRSAGTQPSATADPASGQAAVCADSPGTAGSSGAAAGTADLSGAATDAAASSGGAAGSPEGIPGAPTGGGGEPGGGPSSSVPSERGAERIFEVTYTARVPAPPGETRKIEIWLPYPQDDPYQRISAVHVTASGQTGVAREPMYGNSVLHLVASPVDGRPVEVAMSFTVDRREHVHRFAAAPAGGPGQLGSRQGDEAATRTGGQAGDEDAETPAILARWLAPDRLVPLDARVRALAREVAGDRASDIAKARAIYDYVVSTMRYDKSGTGWGNGDIYWACDAKRGNCTDFHALFIGLCRALGIPAKFAIGLPLPAAHGAGEIAGYHCWAEFYIKGFGWIPVDASEAAKDPAKREYFFGAHDENRVELSRGRDIQLAPRQAGPPLNYFVYPYVEVDDKPFAQVEKSFRYRDLSPR